MGLYIVSVLAWLGCSFVDEIIIGVGDKCLFYDVTLPGSGEDPGQPPSVSTSPPAIGSPFPTGETDTWTFKFNTSDLGIFGTVKASGFGIGSVIRRKWILREDGTTRDIAPAAEMHLQPDVSLGRVLLVTNGSPSIALTINNLDYAVSSRDISLTDLEFGNPLVDGLPWVVLISSATTLTPGQTLKLDVPDAPLAIGSVCYVRSIGPDGRQLYKFPQHITLPVMSEIGLLILIMLIIGGGALTLWRLAHRASPWQASRVT